MWVINKTKTLFWLVSTIALPFLVLACSKSESPTESKVTTPILTTSTVTSVTQTTASSGGSITADGGAAVTDRGICWSTNASPTINNSKTIDGSGTGTFTSNITGLTANTTFYARAYATNSAGTGYGSEVSFKTLEAQQILTGSYVGQTEPGNTPKVFAPGFICIPNHTEYSLSFSPDGSEVYFYRYSSSSAAKIYYSKSVNGIWSELNELSISSGYEAFEPHVTMDNKTLYFFWKNSTREGIYSSTRNASGDWNTPTYFGNNMMYFTSSSTGVLYTTELTASRPYLATVKFQNGAFAGLERLKIKTPPNSYPAHAAIAPDGSYLLFDISGGEHMMVTFKQADGSWGDPIDLTTKGFPIAAGGPYISPDGKYLFFYLNGDINWVSTNVITSLK